LSLSPGLSGEALPGSEGTPGDSVVVAPVSSGESPEVEGEGEGEGEGSCAPDVCVSLPLDGSACEPLFCVSPCDDSGGGVRSGGKPN